MRQRCDYTYKTMVKNLPDIFVNAISRSTIKGYFRYGRDWWRVYLFGGTTKDGYAIRAAYKSHRAPPPSAVDTAADTDAGGKKEKGRPWDEVKKRLKAFREAAKKEMESQSPDSTPAECVFRAVISTAGYHRLVAMLQGEMTAEQVQREGSAEGKADDSADRARIQRIQNEGGEEEGTMRALQEDSDDEDEASVGESVLGDGSLSVGGYESYDDEFEDDEGA